MPRDPRQDPALGAGDRALWLLQLGVCQTVMAIPGHVRVPPLHTLGPQIPYDGRSHQGQFFIFSIFSSSNSVTHCSRWIFRLVFVEPGIGQLFLDTAVHGILRRYTIASPQPYFLSPCSGVGTGPWVGASGWGDLAMTPVDNIEIFHLGSGSHVEETAQLYTFPPSRLSQPPQGKCLCTGPLGLRWSRCPAALQGANTSPHPPPG